MVGSGTGGATCRLYIAVNGAIVIGSQTAPIHASNNTPGTVTTTYDNGGDIEQIAQEVRTRWHLQAGPVKDMTDVLAGCILWTRAPFRWKIL